MLFSVAVLALIATVQGRAVNISNTWVLPEEGFPVFYRYFRDRISWYEADAVCQFHHANLVTVDTTAQYDAVRAYLKELDISSAVWVGLIRSNPDGDFTWTDYRGLSGEGYWSSAPDARSAPLCAAADPAADYRWEARACGGPTVASFICELPVPQWALGNEGCMIRALPALTILYLPESAAVQLTADCGMAGVKKVQCTGNVKRETLLKELSCAEEEELSTASFMSTTSNWPVTSDSTFTDQDTTNEVTTEETITTEHEIDINQPRETTITSLPHIVYPQTKYTAPKKVESVFKLNRVPLNKNVNLEQSQDNNLQSNFVPKTAEVSNVLTSDQLEKLEDERHKQHKMLHEEIARVGNVDNIFTQPTDHFIPPLVMAKAKISDDMTVLSLAEKHAQQLAEKQFTKQNVNNEAIDHSYLDNYGKIYTEDNEKPLISTAKPIKWRDSKKDILKNHSPKKYVNEKHNDIKNKILKLAEIKSVDIYKLTPKPLSLTSTLKPTGEIDSLVTTEKNNLLNKDNKKSDISDDFGIDLTVILNDSPLASEEQPSFSGDVAKLETIQNHKANYTEPSTPTVGSTTKSDVTTNSHIDVTTTPETKIMNNITTSQEILKITIIGNDNARENTTVFEVTTKMPVFKDSSPNITTSPFSTTYYKNSNVNPTSTIENHEMFTSVVTEKEITTTPAILYTSTISPPNLVTENLSTIQPVFTSTEIKTSTEIATKTIVEIDNKTENPIEEKNISATTALPIVMVELDNTTNLNISKESVEKSELNSAEYHEMLMNMTDHQQTDEEYTTDGDFQSPLLSGVMEPVHRPPRTRRPQQPNRNKFNPFRILG